MSKRILCMIASVFAVVIPQQLFALEWFAEEKTIINDTKENIVEKDLTDQDNLIGVGMKGFWEKLNGVWKGDIDDSGDAREKLLNAIKGVINFILGLIGLMALLYLIYHGLKMLFNPGDDAKIEEGWKAIRYAAMAIIGVGVAWFIVSIIFQVIFVVIDATQ